MLTPADVQAIESALGALRASVEAVEEQYRASRNWLWFVYEDETARRAREVAEARRATYERLRARRDELVEAPGYMPAEVAALIDGARAIANDGMAAQLGAELASSPDRATFVANVAAGTVRDLTTAAADAAPAWRAAFKVLPFIIGALVLLVVWQAVRAFIPGRRA